MMGLGPILYSGAEALASIRRERRRLFPMALGIVWGMASVMVLLAVADGFEESQRHALSAYGERFIHLRLNRAELDRSATGKERRLMMWPEDLERIRKGAPAIKRFTPMNLAYRSRIIGRMGSGSNVWIAGVTPELARIRNVPMEEGRFLNEFDEEEHRRVMVLGPLARKQLFGNLPAVGRMVRVTGFSTNSISGRDAPRGALDASRRGGKVSATKSVSSPGALASLAAARPSSASTRAVASARPAAAATAGTAVVANSAAAGKSLEIPSQSFEVIGVIKDVEVQRESYASLARNALVPFSTSTCIFDKHFGTIILEPRTVEDHDLALRQFKEVMGARFGFGPEDRNAVVIYFDAIERARSIAAIFGGLRFFLGVVGVLILAVGAIGVMNVVLVSVAARTFEIGLRKALGATPFMISLQFFAETFLVCLASGLLGFLLGAGAIALLSELPLPEGFSKPVLDARAASTAFGLLAAVAILVGIYPARRAARLEPSAALRRRG